MVLSMKPNLNSQKDQEVKQIKIPVHTTEKTSSLYYYCSVGDTNNKERDEELKARIRKMILNHEIYYKTKDQVNDPFEFLFVPSFEATTEEKIRAYAAYLKKYQNYSDQMAVAIASSEYIGKTEIQVKRKENAQLMQLQKMINNTAFFCLSETPDNILLWSHYADCHRGVCIEFTTDISKKPHILWNADNKNAEPTSMIYAGNDELPVMNFYKDDWEQIVTTIFKTKSKQWKYEGEYRSIQVNAGKGLKKIPAGLISGVILGLNVSEDDKKFILNLRKQSSTPIKIKKASREVSLYKIRIEDL